MKYRKMLELVRALRSGKYEQTMGVLRTGAPREYKYCCLGVACVVAGKRFKADHECQGETGILPERVQDYFGFISAKGRVIDGNIVIGGGHYEDLISANDGGRSFPQIADAIKANWRRL